MTGNDTVSAVTRAAFRLYFEPLSRLTQYAHRVYSIQRAESRRAVDRYLRVLAPASLTVAVISLLIAGTAVWRLARTETVLRSQASSAFLISVPDSAFKPFTVNGTQLHLSGRVTHRDVQLASIFKRISDVKSLLSASELDLIPVARSVSPGDQWVVLNKAHVNRDGSFDIISQLPAALLNSDELQLALLLVQRGTLLPGSTSPTIPTAHSTSPIIGAEIKKHKPAA
jgi:hypothetical protein